MSPPFCTCPSWMCNVIWWSGGTTFYGKCCLVEDPLPAGGHVASHQKPLIILQSKILHNFSTMKYALIHKLACCINHYNSLFLAFSHNFISPHFCIKYLKMPTMIAVMHYSGRECQSNHGPPIFGYFLGSPDSWKEDDSKDHVWNVSSTYPCKCTSQWSLAWKHLGPSSHAQTQD